MLFVYNLVEIIPQIIIHAYLMLTVVFINQNIFMMKDAMNTHNMVYLYNDQ